MSAQGLEASVRTGAEYEGVRRAALEELATAQAERRVELGSDLALVFPGAAAVRAALEEALRADRVAEPDAVSAQAEAFAALLPGDGELAATLYVDVADAAALGDRVAALAGIVDAVSLEVDGTPAGARQVAGDGVESGAAHLVFGLDAEQRRRWLAGAPVEVVVDHPAARRRVELDPATRAAIGADLQA